MRRSVDGCARMLPSGRVQLKLTPVQARAVMWAAMEAAPRTDGHARRALLRVVDLVREALHDGKEDRE